jgi:hypothetical protein
MGLWKSAGERRHEMSKKQIRQLRMIMALPLEERLQKIGLDAGRVPTPFGLLLIVRK